MKLLTFFKGFIHLKRHPRKQKLRPENDCSKYEVNRYYQEQEYIQNLILQNPQLNILPNLLPTREKNSSDFRQC